MTRQEFQDQLQAGVAIEEIALEIEFAKLQALQSIAARIGRLGAVLTGELGDGFAKVEHQLSEIDRTLLREGS